MGKIGFFITLSSVLCIWNSGLVNADEEGYYEDQDLSSSNNEDEEPPTAADMFQLCLFSTFCYVLLLGPFWFGPRLKRDIEAFKLNGVPTEATLLSQSIAPDDDSSETHYNILLVRFTNTKGQRIEKEMHVGDSVFDEIDRGNLKTLTIYTLPDHPFSASLGDARHEEYSLLAKLLCTVGSFSLAAAGVYCFVVYFTYFRSIGGFVGMIVMHVVMAVLSYLGMERFVYHAKRMDAYMGGSLVFDDDPQPMLGVSNTATSAGQGYNAMT